MQGSDGQAGGRARQLSWGQRRSSLEEPEQLAQIFELGANSDSYCQYRVGDVGAHMYMGACNLQLIDCIMWPCIWTLAGWGARIWEPPVLDNIVPHRC